MKKKFRHFFILHFLRWFHMIRNCCSLCLIFLPIFCSEVFSDSVFLSTSMTTNTQHHHCHCATVTSTQQQNKRCSSFCSRLHWMHIHLAEATFACMTVCAQLACIRCISILMRGGHCQSSTAAEGMRMCAATFISSPHRICVNRDLQSTNACAQSTIDCTFHASKKRVSKCFVQSRKSTLSCGFQKHFFLLFTKHMMALLCKRKASNKALCAKHKKHAFLLFQKHFSMLCEKHTQALFAKQKAHCKALFAKQKARFRTCFRKAKSVLFFQTSALQKAWESAFVKAKKHATNAFHKAGKAQKRAFEKHKACFDVCFWKVQSVLSPCFLKSVLWSRFRAHGPVCVPFVFVCCRWSAVRMTITDNATGMVSSFDTEWWSLLLLGQEQPTTAALPQSS